jgi:hypothetical protein
MAPNKPAQRRGRQKKQGARSGARGKKGETGSRLDQAVRLQQRAIGRYAELASVSANRIVEGDFNMSRWVKDYSTVWSECAGDLGDAANVLLQGPSEKARDGKKDRRRPEDWYRSWLGLQQSFLSRLATYYRDVAKLVAKGSLEPREWIEGGTSFWSDVLADMGDWARRESGEELRPTAEWMARIRQQVRAGKLTAQVAIDVPVESFPRDGGDAAEVTLVTDGLSRVGGGVKLSYKQNVELVPEVVRRSHPYSALKLFDLPQLVPNSVYAGIVWAKETQLPVATVEIQIV